MLAHRLQAIYKRAHTPAASATQVGNILVKLQVTDRAQAIVQARDANMGRQSRTWQDIQPTSYPILPATTGTPAS
jgi:hypothetical protein